MRPFLPGLLFHITTTVIFARGIPLPQSKQPTQTAMNVHPRIRPTFQTRKFMTHVAVPRNQRSMDMSSGIKDPIEGAINSMLDLFRKPSKMQKSLIHHQPNHIRPPRTKLNNFMQHNNAHKKTAQHPKSSLYPPTQRLRPQRQLTNPKTSRPSSTQVVRLAGKLKSTFRPAVIRSPHSGEIVTPMGAAQKKQKTKELMVNLHQSLSQLMKQETGSSTVRQHKNDNGSLRSEESDWIPKSKTSNLPTISSTPSSAIIASRNPVTLSTAEQEDGGLEVFVVDLSQGNYAQLAGKGPSLIDINPTPALSSAHNDMPKRQDPPRAGLSQGLLKGFSKESVDAQTNIRNRFPRFNEEFTNLEGGGENLKNKLETFASEIFKENDFQIEGRSIDNAGSVGCSDLVSDCYERLLDARIGELKREMRRLEVLYWGDKE